MVFISTHNILLVYYSIFINKKKDLGQSSIILTFAKYNPISKVFENSLSNIRSLTFLFRIERNNKKKKKTHGDISI
jgi:hypothetical protein